MNLLNKKELSEKLDEVAQYQVIDLKVVKDKISHEQSMEGRINLLKQQYPCLCIYVLERIGDGTLL